MWLLAPFRLIARTARRFHGEHCVQTAAALSFATLIGLVPMIVVAFSLVSVLPVGVGLGSTLEKFLLANLLPDRAGVIIAKYLGQFAARAGRVTFFGIAVLAVMALMQMLTIERAFNRIWQVKISRPLVRRLIMHGLALLLGPLAFGGSLAAISYIAGVSLGLFNEPLWVGAFVIRGLLPFIFMTALFGLLYWGVPGKPVKASHAAFGGAIAALGFAGLQKLFTLYIATTFTLNAAVYGAFSAIPLFLTWLFASWSVILIGALLVAELPKALRA
ncbi:MAG: YihY family inner membrane protein [Burkholderiaceae bacterium]|nr:YihY family inner membrane protein [Sulfuritalea sp.]MCF8176818.1 YihY family inner membrane protein [Burkholderiaceae bacterium]